MGSYRINWKWVIFLITGNLTSTSPPGLSILAQIETVYSTVDDCIICVTVELVVVEVVVVYSVL